jgi:pimeloyl-ACP methyl ester carboxylesterase
MKRPALHGRSIAYEDIGRGTPVVLAHCSSAAHREWSSLTRALRGRYRVLART